MEVGDRAPPVRAVDHRGELFEHGEDCSRAALVVFFYPRAETPVCTKEACAFQDLSARFAALGARVVGVSADSPERHRSFARRHGLDYPLLSDADGSLRRAFGVKRRWWLLPGRETFVIDADGVIQAVVRDLFSHHRHREVALEVLERLDAGVDPTV